MASSCSEVTNVANNSLPNHGARVNVLLTEEDGPNPVRLIKPVEKESKASRAYYLELRSPQNYEVKKKEDLEELFWDLLKDVLNLSVQTVEKPVYIPCIN